uniref:Uncharacterized protein n=1 Tax=Sipha flava TaxID=143950 RepID=A0A2S2QI42_9HEMI
MYIYLFFFFFTTTQVKVIWVDANDLKVCDYVTNVISNNLGEDWCTVKGYGACAYNEYNTSIKRSEKATLCKVFGNLLLSRNFSLLLRHHIVNRTIHLTSDNIFHS